MNDAPTPDAPALVDVREVARKLGVSPATVWRAHSAGLIPSPVRLLRLTRWNRQELDSWLSAGCPPRVKWTWTPAAGGGQCAR